MTLAGHYDLVAVAILAHGFPEPRMPFPLSSEARSGVATGNNFLLLTPTLVTCVMLMPLMPFFILACAMLAIEITGFVSVAVMGVWWWRRETAVGRGQVKKLAKSGRSRHDEAMQTASHPLPSEPAADQTLAEPSVCADIAARIEKGFRQAANQAIQEAHAAGLAVPVLGSDGRAVWLNPDGTVTSD